MFFNKLLIKSKKIDLDVGDIIWAKRYKNKRERLKIDDGHQEGPYVIIAKRFNSFLALPCTSNIKESNWAYRFVTLSKEKYRLNKNSYVHTTINEKIKMKRIIWKIDKLDNSDLNYLFKVLYIVLNSNCNKDNIKIKKVKFSFDVGDLIYYKGGLFYIFDKDSNFYHVYNVNKTDRGNIIINNNVYSFNFNAPKKISIKKKVLLFDVNRDIDMIDILKTKYFNDMEYKKTAKKGSLIKYGNDYFYIYGEYSSYWLVYEVFMEKVDGFKSISIDMRICFTNFSSYKIGKKENIKIITCASNEEIESIKYIKSKQNKQLRKKSEKIYCRNIREKCIIINSDTLDKYVVIKRDSNLINCVLLDDLNKEFTITLSYNCNYRLIRVLDNIEFQNIKINRSKSPI